MTRSYVVCTVKPWNIAAFRERTPALAGLWHLSRILRIFPPTCYNDGRHDIYFFLIGHGRFRTNLSNATNASAST